MITGFIHFVPLLSVLAGRQRTSVLEKLALRQQLALYRRSRPKPAVQWIDRLLWIRLRWSWADWRAALVVVRPATVID